MDIENQQHAGRVVGKTVLFLGNQCQHWTPDNFSQASQRARLLGIDTISAKRADGSVRWYKDPDNLKAEYQAVTQQGCGYIPFTYCYGPAFGLDFIDEECQILVEIQETLASLQSDGIGFVCADLESEWDGRVDAASRFNERMQNNHLLYLTSWSNINDHNWTDVLNILRDCINAYVPQEYNNALAGLADIQLPLDLCVQPAIDLSSEFGQNDAVAITHRAKNANQTTVWIWEYTMIDQVPDLVKSIVNMIGGSVPDTRAPFTYVVQVGDTMSSIAEKLGVSLSDLESWNPMQDYDLIYPDQVLTYKK